MTLKDRTRRAMRERAPEITAVAADVPEHTPRPYALQAIRENRLRELLAQLDEAADEIEFLQDVYTNNDDLRSSLIGVEETIAEAAEYLAESLHEIREGRQ